jgi:hypothetical protein
MSDEFTDATKAAIFARDRATCCFSGANLWLLDKSLRTGWQADLADHIKPRSRGGTAAPENGVCASHTYIPFHSPTRTDEILPHLHREKAIQPESSAGIFPQISRLTP